MAWRELWSLVWRGVCGAMLGYWLFCLVFEASKIQVGWRLLGFIVGIPLLTFIGGLIGTIVYGLPWAGRGVNAIVSTLIGGTIGSAFGALTFYWRYGPGQREIEGMSIVMRSDLAMGCCIGFTAALIAGLHKKRREP